MAGCVQSICQNNKVYMAIYRTQSALLELLDEFGVASYEQYRHGSKVLLGSNGNKSTYKNSIPSIDWCSLIDLNRTIAKVVITICS
jgi:hypothetical protein